MRQRNTPLQPVVFRCRISLATRDPMMLSRFARNRQTYGAFSRFPQSASGYGTKWDVLGRFRRAVQSSPLETCSLGITAILQSKFEPCCGRHGCGAVSTPAPSARLVLFSTRMTQSYKRRLRSLCVTRHHGTARHDWTVTVKIFAFIALGTDEPAIRPPAHPWRQQPGITSHWWPAVLLHSAKLTPPLTAR